MQWLENNFLTVPGAFQIYTVLKVFSSHTDPELHDPNTVESLTYIVDINGLCHIVEYNEIVDLSKMVDEDCNSSMVLEFFCGDMLQTNRGDYLATCWVLQDHICQNLKQFGVLFKVEETKIEKIMKVDFPSTFAHNKLFVNSNDAIDWIIFPLKEEVTVLKLSLYEKTSEWISKELWCKTYPDLNTGKLPGAALCGSRIQNGSLMWNILGYDMGYITLNVYNSDEEKSLGQKTLKFSGAISIAQFITSPVEREEFPDEILILISSTVGPCIIWRCSVKGGVLSWKKVSTLSESQMNDSVTCCLLGDDSIFVGFYADALLVYPRPSLQCTEISENLLPITQVEISAPLVKLCFLESSQESIGVLSTDGLHSLMLTESEFTVFGSEEDEQIVEREVYHSDGLVSRVNNQLAF